MAAGVVSLFVGCYSACINVLLAGSPLVCGLRIGCCILIVL